MIGLMCWQVFLACYTCAMFIKLTRAGGHSYAQLVESFRNEEGKHRQRTVATIGRHDETGGAVDSLLNGLLRATGRQPVGIPSSTVTHVSL